VTLLVTVVLGDVVEVIPTDDQSTMHLGRDDGACQDTATDGDETSEGALLVYRLEPRISEKVPAISTKSSPPLPHLLVPELRRILQNRPQVQPVPPLSLTFSSQHHPVAENSRIPRDKPMKEPSMAVLGVLNPRPTSLYHLLPPFPTLRFAERTFWAVKM
jgi:hypothetical protein